MFQKFSLLFICIFLFTDLSLLAGFNDDLGQEERTKEKEEEDDDDECHGLRTVLGTPTSFTTPSQTGTVNDAPRPNRRQPNHRGLHGARRGLFNADSSETIRVELTPEQIAHNQRLRELARQEEELMSSYLPNLPDEVLTNTNTNTDLDSTSVEESESLPSTMGYISIFNSEMVRTALHGALQNSRKRKRELDCREAVRRYSFF